MRLALALGFVAVVLLGPAAGSPTVHASLAENDGKGVTHMSSSSAGAAHPLAEGAVRPVMDLHPPQIDGAPSPEDTKSRPPPPQTAVPADGTSGLATETDEEADLAPLRAPHERTRAGLESCLDNDWCTTY